MYQFYFFDLDGTITDSSLGITKFSPVCACKVWDRGTGQEEALSFYRTASCGVVPGVLWVP